MGVIFSRMIMSKFIDSAILLGVCTALLFSWSTAHYHGFLVVAKLDADLMERSFHQVIYSGLVLSILPLFITLFFISAILFLYSHVVVHEYVNYVRKNFKNKRKVVKLRKYWIGKRVSPQIEKKEKRRFNYFALLFVIATAFLLSLVFFENKGNKHAKASLKEYEEKTNKNNLISVPFKSGKKTLYYLGCGAKNCAGIEKGTNKVFYFQQSVSFSFVHHMKI